MKFIRKEGITKMRVEYNKKLLWIIFALIILLIGTIVAIQILNQKNKEKANENNENYCEVNDDCVPSSCCHASLCVSSENAPDCSDVSCTQECRQGTLDCGQGSCKCLNNACRADFSQNNTQRRTA